MLSRISKNTSVAYLVVCFIVIGFGSGLIWTPLSSHMFKALPLNLISRTTSLTGGVQQIICSFAIAGITGFLASHMTYHMINIKNRIDASILSYNEAFLLCAAIAIVGIIFSIIMRNTKIKIAVSKVK